MERRSTITTKDRPELQGEGMNLLPSQIPDPIEPYQDRLSRCQRKARALRAKLNTLPRHELYYILNRRLSQVEQALSQKTEKMEPSITIPIRHERRRRDAVA